jgi:coenzyme F420-reducing hydrogenase delta subunit
MSFEPKITLFSCHYVSQQSCAEQGKELQQLGFPESITMVRVPCTGKVQVTALLQAFEDGADGVYVVGCPVDGCHNVKGSARAAKRVAAVKKALEELDVEGARIEMFHLPRGLHPEFVAAGVAMDKKIRALGPSPFQI